MITIENGYDSTKMLSVENNTNSRNKDIMAVSFSAKKCMVEKSNVKLVIDFNDPNLEAEERERQAQSLMVELKQMDEIESVKRVRDPNPPEGSKALSSFLVGLLMAEVSTENAKRLLKFLRDRLGNKPIELEIEANGKSLKVKAHSKEELETAIKAALDFIKL